jgi:hypothetical protein
MKISTSNKPCFDSFKSIKSSLKSKILVAFVEVSRRPGIIVSRRPGIIVSRNEEFMIAALLTRDAVLLWEISRTPTVLFCHWTVGNLPTSPKGG